MSDACLWNAAQMTSGGPKLTRGLAATCLSLVLVASACTGGDNSEADGADAETESAIAVGPDGYGAVITRTADGVPHIRASDLAGVSFGQGWASAEDHPCDLVDQVIEIQSLRAATFGPGEEGENIESDFGWAALGIAERAAADWEDIGGQDKAIIEGFAAGWNASFEDQGADGIQDWCTGAEWMRAVEPVELYAYARSVALLASGARLVDFIAAAQPPDPTPADTAEGAAPGDSDEANVASNGWAVGSELTENGTGIVVGNPHFPWIGELRFSEVQLTTEDGLDVYGVQLLGLPTVGIGFTEGVAWTHTVSAGRRFTAYEMELAPGDPTAYVLDGETIPMESQDISVGILGDDGEITEATRTYWSTEFGPVIDFPGLGWTEGTTASYRDANIDNDRLFTQIAAMNRAQSVEELEAAQREFQGIPLFNTVAADSEGNVWYADTSSTPNLSPEALAAYEARLEAGGLTELAAESGAVLLEGNTSRDRWVEDPDAPWPGVLPFDDLPSVKRQDYVMNANGSYWIANADAPTEGEFSPLQGPSGKPSSVRTRQNLAVLEGDTPLALNGEDGLFGLEELRSAALDNGAFTVDQWLTGVVERCEAAPGSVRSEDLSNADGEVVVPARDVALGEACVALGQWDGHYDVDSVGAVLWREFTEQVAYDELWAVPFDEGKPTTTPSGLAPAGAEGPDAVLVGLANAVALLEFAGVALDAPLGAMQYDARVEGERPPVGGGLGSEGITNVVSDGRQSSSTTEAQPSWPERLVEGSTLTADGYPISYGSSFMMAVEMGPDGPDGYTILTYGQVGDPDLPGFTVGVEAFADKQWKPALFSEADIEADTASVTEVSA